MILNYCIRNGFLLYGKHMSNESWCHFNSISFWILFFLFAYRGRASPCFRLVLCIFDKMNLNHLRIFSNLITTTACHGKEVGNIHNTQKYSRHEFITTPDEFYVQKTEKKKNEINVECFCYRPCLLRKPTSAHPQPMMMLWCFSCICARQGHTIHHLYCIIIRSYGVFNINKRVRHESNHQQQ